MRVLIVKTSSLAEVIHTLPAITDAKQAMPSVVFDWMVEEDFAEIPALHPAVDNVIPVALHRWRKHVVQSLNSVEWKQFRTQLGKHHYDLVIDAQGLMKSSWLASLVKAPVAGFDRQCVRERLATLSYRHRYFVPRELPSVERTRTLFAQALGYEKPNTQACHGLDRSRFCSVTPEAPTIVFLHGTSTDDKIYPEADWINLAGELTDAGFRVRLPWSTEAEKARASRIAEGRPSVDVLPKLNLQGVAGVLGQASAVVAINSGLGQLSAALDVPTVFLETGQLCGFSDASRSCLVADASGRAIPSAVLDVLSPIIKVA